MIYIVNITRVVICFIFFYSFASKLRDYAAFERSINNFQILPAYLERLAAIGFLLLELLIVVAALLGGDWLYLSYSLTIILLVVFVYAIGSVLRRNIQTSCNCFGTNEQKVSSADIWRNIGIIVVALIGLSAFFSPSTQSA